MEPDRDDIIGRLRAGRETFLSHADAPPADHQKSYAPGKWTVREILAHVADCEAVFYWRAARAASEPGTKVESFEENDWAAALDYKKRPVSVSRGLFGGVRDAMIELVKSLPMERLLTTVVHPDRGPFETWKWASLSANHARHHLEQATAARAGTPWVKLREIKP
jgi:hypothetical protein